MSLPVTGSSDWGVQLNSYITSVVLAEANTAAANITAHEAAADPHGDRAYALGLVQPLTSGVNGPNGFLQLNGAGRINSDLVPTGAGRTSTFDVVADYGAPVNGTAAASDIQNALTAAGAVGGGEVWVGDGTFGIDSTLYIPSGVWLHLSPGATMTRLVNAGSGLAPAYMAANFNGSVSSTGSGNILIEGGSWVFDSQSAAGTPMAFVNGTGITVRDTSIRTLQGSPAVLFAGCTNATARGIQYSTAAPVSARTAYVSAPPAVRVETSVSSVIPGLNSAMYTTTACTSVFVKDSVITGATSSDGTGLYTAFGGIAGTTAPVSSSYHANVMVTGNTAVALPYDGVYAANWKSATVTGNQLSINDGTTAAVTWSPSAPSGASQVIDPLGMNLSAYKPANTTRSNTTTLTLDPDLQVTVAASAVYEVRCAILYDSSSSSEGINFDFQIPSGAYFTYAENEPVNSSGGAGVYWNTAGSPDNAATGGSFAVQFTGMVQTSTTPGIFGFKWAQDSGSGTSLTVGRLSYMSLTRIA